MIRLLHQSLSNALGQKVSSGFSLQVQYTPDYGSKVMRYLLASPAAVALSLQQLLAW